jgi:hypothetical protein
MSYLNDIEDFSTDQLRAEINRREQATREGKCWYCQMNLEAHTCKHAKPSPVPGWEINPSRWVETENCMAQKEEYWQTDGRNLVMGMYVIGIGGTKEEATNRCIENAKRCQKVWKTSFLDKKE